jgi:flagellar hook-basal body complex protein FliE
MGVGMVKGIPGLDLARLYGAGAAPAAPAANGPSFADQLRGALQEVNRLQGARDETVQGMVAGTVQNPHDVMIATEEAQLAFELMLEVRNRLIESYQEIMRLQV